MSLKVMFVGDEQVGKTALIARALENDYPSEYVPSQFDSSVLDWEYDEDTVTFYIIDVSGSVAMESFRPLVYSDRDAIVLCFAIDDKKSFEHVDSIWLEEASQYGPNALKILVGTKSDRLQDETTEYVDNDEISRFCEINKIHAFVPCSALKDENISEVFDAIYTTFKQDLGRIPDPEHDIHMF